MAERVVVGKKIKLVVWIVFTIAAHSVAADEVVEVYKSPTCGCCSAWIAHLESEGFSVEASNVERVAPYKEALGVPHGMGSCHTATVEGYFIEGHVPAEDIRRLLVDRPDIIGLTVPGMPIGSPGMEVPGRKLQPYDVYAVDRTGKTTVFSSH